MKNDLARISTESIREVELDRRNLVLKVKHGDASYEVDLDRCNDAAQILDWIFQLNGKSWMTNELMGQLIRAFNDACWEFFGSGIQGVFCPFGTFGRANWRDVKSGHAQAH